MKHPIDFSYDTGRTLTAELRDSSGVVLNQAMTEDGSTGYFYITEGTLTGESLATGVYTVRVSDSIDGLVGTGDLDWGETAESVGVELSGQQMVTGLSYTRRFHTMSTPDSTPTVSVETQGQANVAATVTAVAGSTTAFDYTWTVPEAVAGAWTRAVASYAIGGTAKTPVVMTGQVLGGTFDGAGVKTAADGAKTAADAAKASVDALDLSGVGATDPNEVAAAVVAKFNTAGVTVTTRDVTAGGTIEIVRGDDYTSGTDADPVVFNVDATGLGYTADDVSTARLIVTDGQSGGVLFTTTDVTPADETVEGASVLRFTCVLTKAETGLLTRGVASATARVQLTLTGGLVKTLPAQGITIDVV